MLPILHPQVMLHHQLLMIIKILMTTSKQAQGFVSYSTLKVS